MKVLRTKRFHGKDIALIERENEAEPYIVAYGFHDNTTWDQELCFSTFEDAYICFDGEYIDKFVSFEIEECRKTNTIDFGKAMIILEDLAKTMTKHILKNKSFRLVIDYDPEAKKAITRMYGIKDVSQPPTQEDQSI